MRWALAAPSNIVGSATSTAGNKDEEGGIERKKRVFRDDPVRVTLHWVCAFLIIAALGSGFFVLAATPNADPQNASR